MVFISLVKSMTPINHVTCTWLVVPDWLSRECIKLSMEIIIYLLLGICDSVYLHLSTDAYLRYLCSLWYHVGLFLSTASDDVLVRCFLPSQAQGVRIRAYLVGACARTSAVCGEVPHIQPCPKLERAQGHATTLKDRSYHVCFHYPTPTIWLFTQYFLF